MSIPLLDGAAAVAYPTVAGLAAWLHPVGGAAAAIVVCTVTLRLLLLPLTLAAVRGERSRAALAPRVAALQRRYGRDRTRFASELTALYRSAGISPLAGYLPLLGQALFFAVWYRFFTASRIGGHANVLLAHGYLADRLVGGGHPLAFVPLLVALVGLGLVALRRARRVAAATGTAPPGGLALALPFVSVAGAVVMPFAAVLYLVTTVSWSALENTVLRRGLPPAGKGRRAA